MRRASLADDNDGDDGAPPRRTSIRNATSPLVAKALFAAALQRWTPAGLTAGMAASGGNARNRAGRGALAGGRKAGAGAMAVAGAMMARAAGD
ncbi:unnamed protein product [Closterium sp. NIES-53]